jgi:hypothetical protein
MDFKLFETGFILAKIVIHYSNTLRHSSKNHQILNRSEGKAKNNNCQKNFGVSLALAVVKGKHSFW